MVKRLVVLASVAVAGCASAPVEQWQMPPDEWAFVCQQTKAHGYDEVDCAKTPPPIIVVSEVVEDMAAGWEILYGFTYPGEVYIFINPNHPEMAGEIRVHESVHYLLTQTYGLNGMPNAVPRCESEDIARVIGSEWSGKPVDPSWRRGYNC